MKRIFTFLAVSLLSFSISSAQRDIGKVAESAYKKGNKKFIHFDYLRALPHLKEAVNLSPENGKYYLTLGECLFESWKVRESLPYLSRAAKLNSDGDKKISYYYSRALHLNGEYEAAIAQYKTDLERYEKVTDPGYWESTLKIEQCSTGLKLESDMGNFLIDNLGEFVNSIWPDYASTYADNYQYMLFTTRRPGNRKDITGSIYLPEDINEEVYSSNLGEMGWAKTRRMQKPIHVFRHDASVSISEDGNTLMYYQNRNFGDIYVSQKQNGKWGKRESIGANINTTKYKEPSCFIGENGKTLFFVSDQKGGQGGSDIYFAEKQANGVWGIAQNMGPVINTEYEEDAPFLTEDGKTLYFSSNSTKSMGGFDIFKCQRLPDGSWSEPENLGLPINSPGDDIFFILRRDGQGFFFSSDRVGGMGDMDIYSGRVGRPDNAKPTIVTANIADRKTNEPVDATLTLRDSKSNQEIDENAKKGVDGTYSFELPVPGREYDLNVKVDAPIGGPEGNFIAGKVRDAVSLTPVNGSVKLTDLTNGNLVGEVNTHPATGEFMLSIPGSGPFGIEASSNSYLPVMKKIQAEVATGEDMKHMDILLAKGESGEKYIVNGAHFSPSKWNLLPGAIAELDKAVSILKNNPTFKLKIEGHTDSDGEDAYNLELSNLRAQAVGNYLVGKGIKGERLFVSGLGESKPVNDNGSPEAKRMNRRVEVSILK